LISPATVADSIFVFADGLPSKATVTYYIDNQALSSESQSPYWMGGQRSGNPIGFNTGLLTTGSHSLTAKATANGVNYAAKAVQINVVPSINVQFSSSLTAYPNHLSAQSSQISDVEAHTTTQGASLTAVEQQKRREVLAMYMNWGIDPSLDYKEFQSQQLLDLSPQNWTPAKHSSKLTSDVQLMSPDAPFYHKIPSAWPRVALPSGYFKHVQLNTTKEGDGIGFGLMFSDANTPTQRVRVKWYDDASTLVDYWFPIAQNWTDYLPWQTQGDRHMVFVDSVQQTFLSTYKTSKDSSNGINALAAGGITSLNTLGDRGGSNAARMAELPVLIRDGEATDPNNPIRHAIGGPIHRTWLSRVFPASAWDYGLENSRDSCTGKGYTNTGLIPYGGVIQLDPNLDLTKLGLTLPALRILQAMQQYGYYVMDYGCTDFDIYTFISEKELNPYGGLWGYNRKGPGVQNEVEKVITTSTLYVVPPLMKKQ
jgi:hypothetical protein